MRDEPPQDPDAWTEEQWRAWLTAAPRDPETGRAHPLSRASRSAGGIVLGAAMFGYNGNSTFACIGERCPSNDHSNREKGPADGSPWYHSDGGYALRSESL